MLNIYCDIIVKCLILSHDLHTVLFVFLLLCSNENLQNEKFSWKKRFQVASTIQFVCKLHKPTV